MNKTYRITNKKKEFVELTYNGNKLLSLLGDDDLKKDIKDILANNQLPHPNQIKNFSKELLVKNEKGIIELNTKSLDYFEEYLKGLLTQLGYQVKEITKF